MVSEIDHFLGITPEMTGSWGDSQWRLYPTTDFPTTDAWTTAACVPIRNHEKGPEACEVVLTLNTGRASSGNVPKWEVSGGHLGPINPDDPDGPLESPESAAIRETVEEAGFIVGKRGLFAVRQVINSAQTKSARYAGVTYNAFYWALTETGLITPTDPERPAVGSFRPEALGGLMRAGMLDESELCIINLGLKAFWRQSGEVA